MELQLAPLLEEELADVALLDATAAAGAWPRAALAGRLEAADAADLVALAGGGGPRGERVVGFLLGRVVCDEAELLELAVAAPDRRRGVGRALLEAWLRHVTERGALAAHLEVRAGNSAARRLYEQAGFEPAGLRRGYYARPPDDAVVMRCDLARGHAP